MKTMKKLAAVLLAAAMTLTLLTACGGGGGGGSTSGGDSMETVFNFTGEELTAELNKELSSNAVYDEYLGDRFAAAMNAAMDAGSQFEDSDQAEAVVEGILETAGFSDVDVAATIAPKGAELGLVASGLKSSISKQKISIDGKEIGYAGAKLKGNGNSYMVFAVIQDKT